MRVGVITRCSLVCWSFPAYYNLLALTSTFYYRLITYTAEERIEEPIRADRHRHHCTHSHNHQNHRRLAAFDFQSSTINATLQLELQRRWWWCWWWLLVVGASTSSLLFHAFGSLPAQHKHMSVTSSSDTEIEVALSDTEIDSSSAGESVICVSDIEDDMPHAKGGMEHWQTRCDRFSLIYEELKLNHNIIFKFSSAAFADMRAAQMVHAQSVIDALPKEGYIQSFKIGLQGPILQCTLRLST